MTVDNPLTAPAHVSPARLPRYWSPPPSTMPGLAAAKHYGVTAPGPCPEKTRYSPGHGQIFAGATRA